MSFLTFFGRFCVVFVSFLSFWERVGASGEDNEDTWIHVLIVLPMDHDIVKGGPWSEGVFDVFVSFLTFFGRFCVVFVSFLSFWERVGASGEDNEDTCPHCPPYGSRYSERTPLDALGRPWATLRQLCGNSAATLRFCDVFVLFLSVLGRF